MHITYMHNNMVINDIFIEDFNMAMESWQKSYLWEPLAALQLIHYYFSLHQNCSTLMTKVRREFASLLTLKLHLGWAALEVVK